MAIVLRKDLENKGLTEEDAIRKSKEQGYERALFQEAIKTLPHSVMSYEQKTLFAKDPVLKDSYLADLLDSDKQDVFEQKLGSGVLRAFSTNKTANMLRNEAVHSLKSQGVIAPKGSALGGALDVTNRKAFDVNGVRLNLTDHSLADERALEESNLSAQLTDRRVAPDSFGARTHSLGDTKTNTLYFAGTKDVLSLDADASFSYDGVEMGSAMQAILYAQSATVFNDPNRALALSAEPMSRKDLREKGLIASPYREPAQRAVWDEKSEDVIYDVLKAKYAGDKAAQEALKQTKGYRLMYAVKDSDYGIGQDVLDVAAEQESAVRNNEEFILREVNRDRSNSVGRMTERVRQELLMPEPSVNVQKAHSQDNPFGQYEDYGNMGGYEEPGDPFSTTTMSGMEDPFAHATGVESDYPRSMRFDDPDEEPVGYRSHYTTKPVQQESNSFEQPFISESATKSADVSSTYSTNPFVDSNTHHVADDLGTTVDVEPLEMSIHASQQLTYNGMMRASEAVKRFGDEAKQQGRSAIVYVSAESPTYLKKAVYTHRDAVEMKPLDKHHVPERSLLVQSERTMTRQFQQEIQFATSDSLNVNRDVRALSIDPAEKEMYALNDYLLNKSVKVRVAQESDGVESEMAAVTPNGIQPTQESREAQEAIAALRMNEKHTRNAQESAKQKSRQSAANPAKGIYAENPFG